MVFRKTVFKCSSFLMLVIGVWIVSAWSTKYSIKGGQRFSVGLRYLLISIAEIPNNASKLVLGAKGGFGVAATVDVYSEIVPKIGSDSVSGCVLTSYINSVGDNVVSIINTTNNFETILYSKNGGSSGLRYSDAVLESEGYIKPAMLTRHRIWSPHLSDDGLLVYLIPWNDLVAVDLRTGLERWRVKGAFHHTIELDYEGNYWVCASLRPNSIKSDKSGRKQSNDLYEDQALVKVSPNGKVLKIMSVSDLIIDCGIEHLLYGGSNPNLIFDPIHLNSIKPVNNSRGHFLKGQIIISLRNLSTIMLVDPDSERVEWYRTGPWMNQHSVGYIDDALVYLFDNHSFADGEHWLSDEWYSRVLIHNLASGNTKEVEFANSPLGRIKVPIAGKIQFIPPDAWLVEELVYTRSG